MQYIADIIIVVVIALFTISGIRKGFFRSVTEFLGVILAALLAAAFGSVVSSFIFDTFVRAGMEERLINSLNETSLNIAVSQFFDTLPEFIRNFLESFNITQNGLVGSVSGSNEQIAVAITDSIAPAVIAIINFFVVIILFIVLLIAIKAVSKVVNNIFRIPVLSQINDLLGGAFGFLYSLVVVFVVISAVHFAGEIVIPQYMDTINEALDNSILTGFIMNCNPFAWIFG